MGYYEDMEDLGVVQEEIRQAQWEQINQEAQEAARQAAESEAGRQAEEGARQAAEESSRQYAAEVARQAAAEEERQAAEAAARQAEEDARQAAEDARQAAEKAAAEARRAAAEEAKENMKLYEDISEDMQKCLNVIREKIDSVQRSYNTLHIELASYPASASGKFKMFFNDACGRLKFDEDQMIQRFRKAADSYQSILKDINYKYNYWGDQYNQNNY